MYAELPPYALMQYAGRYVEPPARLAWKSIAAGNTAGRLWAAGSGDASLILWDQGNNLLYLAIDPSFDTGTLRRTIDGPIRAAAIEAGLQRFGVRALDGATEQRVPIALGSLLAGERRSMFWEWPPGRVPPPGRIMLPGVRLQPIDRSLLDREDLAGLDEVRQEIGWMWPSRERFEQYGYGVAALVEQQLVCWCTSEYVGPECCGVGIATAEEFRNRGIATATAAEFVRRAIERGLTPCWECGSDNVASARLAARVGFELLLEHRAWLARFSD